MPTDHHAPLALLKNKLAALARSPRTSLVAAALMTTFLVAGSAIAPSAAVMVERGGVEAGAEVYAEDHGAADDAVDAAEHLGDPTPMDRDEDHDRDASRDGHEVGAHGADHGPQTRSPGSTTEDASDDGTAKDTPPSTSEPRPATKEDRSSEDDGAGALPVTKPGDPGDADPGPSLASATGKPATAASSAEDEGANESADDHDDDGDDDDGLNVPDEAAVPVPDLGASGDIPAQSTPATNDTVVETPEVPGFEPCQVELCNEGFATEDQKLLTTPPAEGPIVETPGAEAGEVCTDEDGLLCVEHGEIEPREYETFYLPPQTVTLPGVDVPAVCDVAQLACIEQEPTPSEELATLPGQDEQELAPAIGYEVRTEGFEGLVVTNWGQEDEIGPQHIASIPVPGMGPINVTLCKYTCGVAKAPAGAVTGTITVTVYVGDETIEHTLPVSHEL